jgi:hypothetical protein
VVSTLLRHCCWSPATRISTFSPRVKKLRQAADRS